MAGWHSPRLATERYASHNFECNKVVRSEGLLEVWCSKGSSVIFLASGPCPSGDSSLLSFKVDRGEWHWMSSDRLWEAW